MEKKVTHQLTFTLGRIGGDKSHDIVSTLTTWIGEDGKWHVHPREVPQWEGIGDTLDLAVLDHLIKRFE